MMTKGTNSKQSYVKQSDVPLFSLDEALRVARAIAEQHGNRATRPMLVAQAMKLTPTSGHFRKLCGASIAYGLTSGGAQAQVIELTDLGRRIVSPTREGDDRDARREAVLRPRVLQEFLQHYDGSQLPSDRSIAKNLLQHEMGVPANRTEGTLELITDSARAAGFLQDINGTDWVDLAAVGDDDGSISDSPPGPDPIAETGTDLTTLPNAQLEKQLLGLNVRIEINLPTTDDSDVYDGIFRSIREHLIDG